MDVMNSNNSFDRTNKKKFKRSTFKVKQFSIEIYFLWFNQLIYLTETIVDYALVCFYFIQNEMQYGTITLTIVIVPSVLCQIYSLWLLRSDKNVTARALMLHILLLGIPYRYYNILNQISHKEKSLSTENDEQSIELIIDRIRDVSSIQTVNAIFQYCPQFFFQSFLLIYLHYTCLLTGVSAGLACFSFIWHICIHFFYLMKHIRADYRLNDHMSSNVPRAQATQIIDNLSTSLNSNSRSIVSSTGVPSAIITEDGILSGPLQLAEVSVTNLSDNLKDFEKPSYKTNMKNFVATKKHDTKNVEKAKIFGFNKRRPIYEKDDFDVTGESSQLSTVFFEINDSVMTSSKLGNISMDSSLNTSTDKELNGLSHSMESLSCGAGHRNIKSRKMCASSDDLKMHNEQIACSDSMISISGSRNSLLKRKGICSSQEMLHLVDVMNDNILPEQVDILAKNSIELGATEKPKCDAIVDLAIRNRLSLLENFPDKIDERLLENIDAAIYENQIIFQERIRKNQLTIQNLKLQDQLLSKCIEDFKLVGDGMNLRDYENVCFENANDARAKNWRKYLYDIETMACSNNSAQNSDFYQHTNAAVCSFTGDDSDNLYINESELVHKGDDSAANESSLTYQDTISTTGDESMLMPCYKKILQWHANKLSSLSNESKLSKCSCDEQDPTENVYMNMSKVPSSTRLLTNHCIGEKNILVETINKINIADSPVKNLGVQKPM